MPESHVTIQNIRGVCTINVETLLERSTDAINAKFIERKNETLANAAANIQGGALGEGRARILGHLPTEAVD